MSLAGKSPFQAHLGCRLFEFGQLLSHYLCYITSWDRNIVAGELRLYECHCFDELLPFVGMDP